MSDGAHNPVDEADEFADLPWEFSESELDYLDPPRPGTCNDVVCDDATDLQEHEVGGEAGLDMSSAVASSIRNVATKTPMALRVGKSKHLNVSQLISVAWCELQVDYGLRHRRDAGPVQKLAPSFVSRQGNTITFTKAVAMQRSKVLEDGTKVHKELEREVHPVAVPEPTARNLEEVWANRLLGMISTFDALEKLDICRELQVFGFVENELVFGCIDEVVRASAVPRKPTAKSRKRKPMLYVLDSKTRAKNRLPLPRDTVPAQLQLMLYRRLLSELIFPPADPNRPSLTPPYVFDRLYQHIGLKPTLPFSKKFSSEIANILGADESTKVRCLSDVVDIWAQTVERLRGTISKISPSLEIVYRRRSRIDLETEPEEQPSEKSNRRLSTSDPDDQGHLADSKPRKRRRLTPTPNTLPSSSTEDEDLQTAIQLSLSPTNDVDVDLQRAIAASLLDISMPDRTGGSGPSAVPSSQHPDMEQDAVTLNVAQVVGMVDSGVQENNLGLRTDARSGESLSGRSDVTPDHSDFSIPLHSIDPPQVVTFDSDEHPEFSTPALNNDAVGDLMISTTPDTVEGGGIDHTTPQSPQSHPSTDDEISGTPGVSRASSTGIIGTTKFVDNPTKLDNFLNRALAYWRGEREPRGVDIEDVGRCWSCEYMEDCEWRKSKAEEHNRKVKLRRKQRSQERK